MSGAEPDDPELASALRPSGPPRPIDRLLAPLQSFAQHQLAGAGLLMLATVAALVLANTGLAHDYHHLLELELGIEIAGHGLHKSLHHWINDGLMGVFFFLVGLEIKRELLTGELSTLRKATLPAIAAVGGMIVPAVIYTALNHDGDAASGWGIPMATDIAFALGVLALLGERVPLGLKVFLTALAIVDDIGAVLVIAIFYTSELSLIALGLGSLCVVASVVLNLLGTRNPVPYFLIGLVAMGCFLESGVHATIAALLMAFTIPARTNIDGPDFLRKMTMLLERLRSIGVPSNTEMNTNPQQRLFESMNELIDQASAPLQRIEHALAGPVTFVVLPVFALANAGVTFGEGIGEAFTHPLVIGIVLGLFVGKTIGISLSAWLAVKLRLADLPGGVSWLEVVGVAMLGGIGFTMALFVAGLAFTDPAQIEAAKVGIFSGSFVSAALGYGLVLLASARAKRAHD
ncbi:MAG: Na+/H+ antiporter NhaA [Sandaracinaceae bacterium]|nr:Na+/H+ antiporter NhaA [Sandaracinaceae bacterium]